MTQDTQELIFRMEWSFFGDFALLPSGQSLDAFPP